MDSQRLYFALMKRFTKNLLQSEFVDENGNSKSGFKGDEKVTFTLSELADIIVEAIDDASCR